MKKILNILSVLGISLLLFTGCVYKIENGVVLTTADRDSMIERSKIKVFLDDSFTTVKQDLMMKEVLNLLKEGIEIPTTFRLVEGYDKKYNMRDENKFFEMKGNKFLLLSNNLSNDEWVKIFKFIKESTNEKSTFRKKDYAIENGKLVSPKYNNYHELIADLGRFAYVQKTENLLKLEEKYGSSKFIVDGNELIKNRRIVLIPILNYFSFKDRLSLLLRTKGFKVVDNEKEANKVLKLETVTITNYENLKKMKFQSLLVNEEYKDLPNNLDTTAKVSNLAMDVSKTMGAGSGTSAGIGLGLFLLDSLIPNDEIKKSISSVFYVKMRYEDEIRLLKFYPFYLNSYYSYQILFKDNLDKYTEKINVLNNITWNLIEFIEDGWVSNSLAKTSKLRKQGN